jgi:hypothetical protein
LEIHASLSLLADGSRLVSRQLVEKSLHQARQNVLLHCGKAKMIIFFVLWIIILSDSVQNVLQSDDLNGDGVVDLLRFHLDG